MKSKLIKFIMSLWPSKKQWKQWSMPSRLTVMGFYAGIFTIALTVLLHFLPEETNTIIEEPVTYRFNYTLYFNKTDKRSLDVHCNNHDAYGGTQFDSNPPNFITKKIAEMKLDTLDFQKDGKKVKDFYFDLAFVKLISSFFAIYPESWDIYLDSTRRGNSLIRIRQVNMPQPKLATLKWNNFFEILDPNDSSYKLLNDFSQEFWIKEMKVPPKTTVGIETSKYKKILLMRNPFAEISIAFTQRSGSVGLGDYQWLLGYDNQKNNQFWSEHIEVVCEAKFERLRSGDSEMPRYKKWAQTMFEEVQYQFDDEKRLIRARDYHDLSSKR